MSEPIHLTQWEHLTTTFTSFFDGIGKVEINLESLAFHSLPSDVRTNFSIHRNGMVNARMPLHGLDSMFNEFEFEHSSRRITCRSEASTYTYQVPQALLSNRGPPQ